MKNALSTLEQTKDAIKEIEDAFFDIPFDNSKFQNEAFVIAAQITPERAYRAIGLKMHNKLQALQQAIFEDRRREIKLAELQEKSQSSEVSKWDRERALIDIEEINAGINFAEKLKSDAIAELECLYEHFKAMPRFTRAQFEAAEANHFHEKLLRQANGLSGPAEAIANMQDDLKALLTYEHQVLQLKANDDETLNLLRLSMTNQLANNVKK